MQPMGLREIKKSQTRELIAQSAADLFRVHGFDAVTMEAIASAATVSRKTVFNYFPTKEDLVFHRADERLSGLLAAVEDRPAGTSVLESFRALCHAQTNRLASLRAAVAAGGGFFELVSANPSLQRKAHELTARFTQALAEALAAEARSDPEDAVAVVVATTLVAAQRALFLRLRLLAASPLGDSAVIRRHRRETDRLFDQLRDGFGAYPTPSGG